MKRYKLKGKNLHVRKGHGLNLKKRCRGGAAKRVKCMEMDDRPCDTNTNLQKLKLSLGRLNLGSSKKDKYISF